MEVYHSEIKVEDWLCESPTETEHATALGKNQDPKFHWVANECEDTKETWVLIQLPFARADMTYITKATKTPTYPDTCGIHEWLDIIELRKWMSTVVPCTTMEATTATHCYVRDNLKQIIKDDAGLSLLVSAYTEAGTAHKKSVDDYWEEFLNGESESLVKDDEESRQLFIARQRLEELIQELVIDIVNPPAEYLIEHFKRQGHNEMTAALKWSTYKDRMSTNRDFVKGYTFTKSGPFIDKIDEEDYEEMMAYDCVDDGWTFSTPYDMCSDTEKEVFYGD